MHSADDKEARFKEAAAQGGIAPVYIFMGESQSSYDADPEAFWQRFNDLKLRLQELHEKRESRKRKRQRRRARIKRRGY